MVEILIIGQGVSGTLLSWFLHQKQHSFHLIDRKPAATASRVAAGLINPLTGRRLVKSWNIENLYPFAEKAYGEIGQYLGADLIQKLSVVKVLSTPEMRDYWAEKAQQAEIAPYFDFAAGIDLEQLSTHVHIKSGLMAYGPAMQADLPQLVALWREKAREMGCFTETDFEYEAIQEQPDGSFNYKGIQARKLVFCEGPWGAANPWFGKLPLRANLGQRLLAKTQLAEGFIYRSNGLTVPLTDQLTWVGSTNDWTLEAGAVPPKPATSTAGLAQLEMQLEGLCKGAYEIVDHAAAYRPTIKDRRPVLGAHPTNPNLYILNGMGTKGASLAPYHAHALCEQLSADLAGLNNTYIDEAVDVMRYFDLF